MILNCDYADLGNIGKKIFAHFPLPLQGKKILLKPNILGPYPPEKGITTHPSLVRALVDFLKKEGAICFVGDNPGLHGYAANERCARISGIWEAAGESFINLAKETEQVQVKSRFLKNLIISKIVLDVDYIINLPKFKTHLQTKITGAVKNMFGIAVGAEKARVHLTASKPEHFAEALLDIYLIRPPELTIMDAIVGMEGNGPSGKDLRHIGKILVSDNGVVLDALMAEMMGINPDEVDYLRLAAERGLGEININKVDIQGQWSPLKKFKLPFTLASQGSFGAVLNKVFYRFLTRPRLKFRRSLCTQCRVCVEHCPAGALTMKDGPILDENKCVACYCCYELCPQQAIEFKGFLGI
ncbi:MAG: DUF362 domain-containing protein [bacterium]